MYKVARISSKKRGFRSQGKTVKILVIEEMDQKYTKEGILVGQHDVFLCYVVICHISSY
jgi:hypothetical protein